MCAILPLRLKRRFTSKQKQQRNGKILWHHWCDKVIVYHISFSKDCNRYRLDISLNLHEQIKQYSAKRINVSSVYHQSNRVISILYNLYNLTGSSTVDHSFIQIYYILWYQSKAQRLYIWTPRDTPPPSLNILLGYDITFEWFLLSSCLCLRNCGVNVTVPIPVAYTSGIVITGYWCEQWLIFTLSYNLYRIFRNQKWSKTVNYAFYSTTTKI